MRILITGGTGLIGQKLCTLLHAEGHHLTVLSRHPESVSNKCGTFARAISSLDEWRPEDVFEVVINLAGEPIADKAWSAKRKKAIWDSRVTLTETLLGKIVAAHVKPAVLLSGSAVGYYGNRQEQLLDESAMAGTGYSAELCAAWERAALHAESLGVRVCLLRTGLVLSDQGGILSRMRLPLGLGVRLGDGQQWMSWIHIEDYVRILLRLMSDTQAKGAFNMTAPAPVDNKTFTRILVELQHGLTTLFVPAGLLKLMLGERASLLLEGQRVLPSKIEATGFQFNYPDLRSALRALLPDAV